MGNLIFEIDNMRRLSGLSLLGENIAQAEKLLRSINFPLDNPEYVELRQELYDKKLNGYAIFIIKASLEHDGNSINMDRARVIENLLINNKEILGNLPKKVVDYTSFNEFYRDINRISVNRDFKKFINMVSSNKILKNELEQNSDEILSTKERYDDIQYFVSPGVTTEDRKDLLTKINKYKDLDTFLNELGEVVSDIKNGFKYESVKNIIESLPNTEVELLDSENNMLIVRILNFKAAEALGSRSWCIVTDINQYDRYTTNINGGINRLYYFFNFNSGVDSNLKMIAFTMDDKNNIPASHDRWDNEFNNPLGYLTTLNIKNKLFELNQREGLKEKFKQFDKPKEKHYETNFTNIKYINSTDDDYLISALNEYFDLLKRNKLSFNLDLIFKKFEFYPIYLKVKYQRSETTGDTLNVINSSFSNKGDAIMLSRKIDKKSYMKMLQNIYMGSIQLSQATKVGIMHYLKNNGVDVLNLSRMNKAKKGEDLGDMEFAMLRNQGKDLSSIIQNKLASIRKGEDVHMSVSEINYAIDNGYKDIIMKYYNSMLPHFAYEQLSYDDLNIYKKLGLLDQVSKIIYKKGNMYGIDSLNSIERSVYDMIKRNS